MIKKLLRLFVALWYNEGRPHPITILDAWRIAMHFPFGAFGAWLIGNNPTQGTIYVVIFLAYELMEDWREIDRSFKDIMGFALGFGILSIFI